MAIVQLHTLFLPGIIKTCKRNFRNDIQWVIWPLKAVAFVEFHAEEDALRKLHPIIEVDFAAIAVVRSALLEDYILLRHMHLQKLADIIGMAVYESMFVKFIVQLKDVLCNRGRVIHTILLCHRGYRNVETLRRSTGMDAHEDCGVFLRLRRVTRW